MAIGFVLILVIFGITVFRPSSKGMKTSEAETANHPKTIDSTKITKLAAKDLAAMLQSDQSIKLLDIRSKDSFANEHIPNSINIPTDSIANYAQTLSKDKKYVVIDDAVNIDTVNVIASIFSQSGFVNLYYLDGGFLDWKKNYYPTINKGDPGSFADQTKVTYIDSDKLKSLMADKNNKLYIIDVRKSAQYAAGHLQDAHNIFVDDLEKRVSEIPLGKTIILYDSDSFSAFMGAVRLFDLGIPNVLTLSDGLDTWSSKGYEIVK